MNPYQQAVKKLGLLKLTVLTLLLPATPHRYPSWILVIILTPRCPTADNSFSILIPHISVNLQTFLSHCLCIFTRFSDLKSTHKLKGNCNCNCSTVFFFLKNQGFTSLKKIQSSWVIKQLWSTSFWTLKQPCIIISYFLSKNNFLLCGIIHLILQFYLFCIGCFQQETYRKL